MNSIYEMTAADIEVLSAASTQPNLFFDHFFSHPGSSHSFALDRNFTEDGKWQEEMCMALQTFIVAICGIGTGKTLGVGMSAAYHGVLTPYFKFMNVARESWQSEQMYEMILEMAEETIFWKMIRPVRRPHYRIDIEYKIAGVLVHSNLQFMSLGEKADATNIFTWRGDWVNIDEAWLIDDLATVVSNLSTRLTGSAPNGRPFLGRMSLTSNPGDSPELWSFYDTAAADKKEGLIFNIDTRSNKNVTEKQVKNLVKRLTKDQQIRFLTGRRPEGKGSYFSIPHVNACANQQLSEIAQAEVAKATPGYVIDSLVHLGVWNYKTPPKEGRIYFQLGDPGTGNAPSRNAPCIMVWDVTDAPKHSFIAAFWWGQGDGSIMPFTTQYLEWIEIYKPIFAGVDNTGPQKNTAEIMNIEYIQGQGKSVSQITGMDFSGSKRYSYLVALRLSIESSMLAWPSILTGIGTQLKHYDPIVDRSPNTKLAQDIVATGSMSAFAIRAYFGAISEDAGSETQDGSDQVDFTRRGNRAAGSRRGFDSASGREIYGPRAEEPTMK